MQQSTNILIAFIYDIPKQDGYTNNELTSIMRALGYQCNVQLNLDNGKPFLSARVKFESEAHLQLALK